MIEFDYEKFSLMQHINELYRILHLTQQNLTNTIDQVKEKIIRTLVFNLLFYL